MSRVLLVNMPFAALDVPSLALGEFKARFQREGIGCDVADLNIAFGERIGMERYGFVLKLSAAFGGERLFAAAVFGSALPSFAEYAAKVEEAGQGCARDIVDLQRLESSALQFIDDCALGIDWSRYAVVGFSSLFEQNVPSLALALRIKQHFPRIAIVMGGANCEAVMGESLHRCFPFVDYVCHGEADDTFPELVKRLIFRHPVSGLPGLVYREGGRSISTGRSTQVRQMDRLPVPNYDDYFSRVFASPLLPEITPSATMETARGCWWGEHSHCTFCGLNGNGMAFRAKTADRAVSEVVGLFERYGTGFIRVVDNIMPYEYFKEMLPQLASLPRRPQLIYEVKANLKKEQFRLMGAAGVSMVQAGIENLSTPVLNLMKKGTTALANMQSMKWGLESGVDVDWNLIYGFPGEVPENYRENVRAAMLCTHLRPPTGIGPIRLDRFSPNFDRAAEFGILNVRPNQLYRCVYPFNEEVLADLVYYFEFDYAQRPDDGGYLAPLKEVISGWQARWGTQRDQLVLTWDGDQAVIRDTRLIARQHTQALTPIETRVYRFCDSIRTIERIVRFGCEECDPAIPERQVRAVLTSLVERALMAVEDSRYLSLAVCPQPDSVELETDARHRPFGGFGRTLAEVSTTTRHDDC